MRKMFAERQRCKVGLKQAFVFERNSFKQFTSTCYETLDLDSEYNKNHKCKNQDVFQWAKTGLSFTDEIQTKKISLANLRMVEQ